MPKKYLVAVLCGLAMGSQASAGFFDSLEPNLRLGMGGGRMALESGDDDTAWSLISGYEFNQYFAAELSWVGDSGSWNIQKPIAGGTQIDDIGNQYWNVSGLGTWAFNDTFSAYGRLGMLRWKGSSTVVTGAGTVKSDVDGFEPIFGAGVAMTIDNAMLRVEYARTSVAEESATYISFSAVWKIIL